MKRLLLILLALVCLQLPAQDLAHYKKVVKELSSAKYQGRGYARGGANKAGKYLEKEYRKAGADEVTLHPFTIDINTVPGKMEMWADGKKLTPGVDFSMREYSPGVHGEFPVYHVDTLNFDADKMFRDLALPEYANALVCCEFWFAYRHGEAFARLQKKDGCTNAGLIQTWTSPIKFYKAYGHRVADKPIIWVTPEAIKDVKTVRVDVDNEFLKDYGLFNVIAKVGGERHDSCYVFTAHYDHLGNLGKKVFYAGANDNASGTAALVTLAAHYAKNRPPFDMYFLSVSGEDANLRGSEYFAKYPTFPLSRIKYLFNVDMIGDNNPSIAIATSSPCDASFRTSSPSRRLLIFPASVPSDFISLRLARTFPARIRTPTIAGLVAWKTQLGKSMNFAGNAISILWSASLAFFAASTHS